MTTYYVENDKKKILSYFSRLRDAKQLVISLCIPFNSNRIVCLKGPYKYEGWHAYYMRYNGKKFYYEK